MRSPITCRRSAFLLFCLCAVSPSAIAHGPTAELLVALYVIFVVCELIGLLPYFLYCWVFSIKQNRRKVFFEYLIASTLTPIATGAASNINEYVAWASLLIPLFVVFLRHLYGAYRVEIAA